MRILSSRLAVMVLASVASTAALAVDPGIAVDSGKLRGAVAAQGNVFKDIPFCDTAGRTAAMDFTQAPGEVARRSRCAPFRASLYSGRRNGARHRSAE